MHNYDIIVFIIFLILPLPRICYLLVCNLEFWGSYSPVLLYTCTSICFCLFFIVVLLRHLNLNYNDKLVPLQKKLAAHARRGLITSK